MRLKLAHLAAAILIFGAAFAPAVSAQNPDTMMPEESTAKAKQIVQQLIEALGGPAYLGVRESECDGRRANFGHNGELTGYIEIKNYRRYPDKSRTDFSKKGNIVDIFNGDRGWTLDRGGVSEEPATSVAEFQEQVKRNIDNLLRFRLKEDGLSFRYAGSDTVDLRQVDWVEITDREERTYRLAVDRSSHLLLHSVVITNDETTRQRAEDLVIYSNYQPKDGVVTPLQISRERDGRRTTQFFYDNCKYNSGLPDDLFTRASLEKRGFQLGSAKKDKKIDKNIDRD